MTTTESRTRNLGKVKTCGNCRFFTGPNDGDPPDACRRYPPKIIEAVFKHYGDDKDGTGEEALCSLASKWPTTHKDCWCGEWRKAYVPEVETDG